MKFFALAVLALATTAHAQLEHLTDYSLCNDTINKTFQKGKSFPHGFIQISRKGEIEPAQCGEAKSKCAINSFNRYGAKEEYTASQDAGYGPYKKLDRSFTIVRGANGLIEKIISEEDELHISYTDKQCVATALVANIPEENIREMNFDIVACKTFHEINKRYGQKLSDCFAKDLETLKNSTNKDVKKVGGSCATELKDVYKNLVSLKSDIISRYEDDKSLKRQPFKNMLPPAVYNDQVVENFICSYEATMAGASEKRDCGQSNVSMNVPGDTAVGIILANKRTCGLVFSDDVLNNEAIFKAKFYDSMVYTFQEAKSGSGAIASRGKGGGGKKGKSE